MSSPSIVLFNKPYGVQSQFRDDDNNIHTTLSEYFSDKSLRVAGRLDATSEGLLILTDDGQVNKAITQPASANNFKSSRKQGKTYLVQVEGVATAVQLADLSNGVMLKDGMTLPATVAVLDECDLPIVLWPRDPPIRERKSIPTSWLMLTIYEGKNRQVRRMSAHVGLPCLRLIRWSVAGFDLGSLGVGQFTRVSLNTEQCQKLGIIR